MLKITNIDWDTDNEEVDLPEEVDIQEDIGVDDAADWLSDHYGFCVYGFSVVKEKEETNGTV